MNEDRDESGAADAIARAKGLAAGLAALARQEGWFEAALTDPVVLARTEGTAPWLRERAPAYAPPWPDAGLTPTQKQYALGCALFEPANAAVASKATMLASGESHTSGDAEYWQRVELSLNIPRLDPPGPRTIQIDWGDGTTATHTFDVAQQGSPIPVEHWYPTPYRAEDDPFELGPVWSDYTVKVADLGPNRGSHYLHVQYPTTVGSPSDPSTRAPS